MYINKFLRYLAWFGLITALTIIFEGVGILNIIQCDFRIIDVPVVLIIIGAVELCLFSYYFVIRKSAGVKNYELIIAKYHCHIWVISACFWVATLYKCYEAVENCAFITTAVCCVELLVFYIVLDLFVCREGQYEYCDTDENKGLHVEKPVTNYKDLTESQKETFNALKNVILERKLSDSINVALVAPWGYGKSSIVNALIRELSNETENYFILKINALTLQEPQNIVQYVKRYFEFLFRKYGIGLPGLNISFFSSLLNIMSEDVGTVLDGAKEGFYDIEKERNLFNRQVGILLKRSRRKNILFFIDDIDRCKEWENIIRLLQEFSEINGLITFISLGNKTYDKMNGSETLGLLNRFIHERIEVDSYENNINHVKATEMLVQAYRRPNDFAGLHAIASPGMYKGGKFFNSGILCETQGEDKAYSFNGRRDLLCDIVIEQIRKKIEEGERVELGKYLNKMVTEYMCNNERFFCETRDDRSILESEENEDEEPLSRYELFLEMLCTDFETMLIEFAKIETAVKETTNPSYLKMLREKKLYSDHPGEYNEPSAIDFIKDRNLIYDEKHDRVVYSNSKNWELVLMTSEEWQEFESQLAQCYDIESTVSEVSILLSQKYQLFQDYNRLVLLLDIIKSVDKSMDNFREYKFELRESEILKENYLTTLINSWHVSQEADHSIKKLAQMIKVPITSENSIDVYKMHEFVDDIFFMNTVQLAFNDGEDEYKEQRKIVVLGSEKKSFVCITHKERDNDFFIEINGGLKRRDKIDGIFQQEYEGARDRLWSSDQENKQMLGANISV